MSNSTKKITGFGLELFQSRKLIVQLTKRDFQNRYAGSTLGLLWAFIQPIMMMGILWAVFTFGLKSGAAKGNIPFVAWFFTGMIAWNFFSDGLLVSTNVLNEYAFLVRKVRFRVAILPFVKILASLVLHLIFLALLLLILISVGIYPEFLWFQIFYYTAAAFLLLVGLSWITSSMNVFLKDVGQIIGIVVQFGFWATPVIWEAGMVPSSIQPFIKLNPVFYIIEGYRGTFLYHTPIWHHSYKLALYYWSFTAVVMLLGIIVFRKLRPHFADVL